jgi:hypothetical protein
MKPWNIRAEALGKKGNYVSNLTLFRLHISFILEYVSGNVYN